MGGGGGFVRKGPGWVSQREEGDREWVRFHRGWMERENRGCRGIGGVEKNNTNKTKSKSKIIIIIMCDQIFGSSNMSLFDRVHECSEC